MLRPKQLTPTIIQKKKKESKNYKILLLILIFLTEIYRN